MIALKGPLRMLGRLGYPGTLVKQTARGDVERLANGVVADDKTPRPTRSRQTKMIAPRRCQVGKVKLKHGFAMQGDFLTAILAMILFAGPQRRLPPKRHLAIRLAHHLEIPAHIRVNRHFSQGGQPHAEIRIFFRGVGSIANLVDFQGPGHGGSFFIAERPFQGAIRRADPDGLAVLQRAFQTQIGKMNQLCGRCKVMTCHGLARHPEFADRIHPIALRRQWQRGAIAASQPKISWRLKAIANGQLAFPHYRDNGITIEKPMRPGLKLARRKLLIRQCQAFAKAADDFRDQGGTEIASQHQVSCVQREYGQGALPELGRIDFFRRRPQYLPVCIQSHAITGAQ